MPIQDISAEQHQRNNILWGARLMEGKHYSLMAFGGWRLKVGIELGWVGDFVFEQADPLGAEIFHPCDGLLSAVRGGVRKRG